LGAFWLVLSADPGAILTKACYNLTPTMSSGSTSTSTSTSTSAVSTASASFFALSAGFCAALASVFAKLAVDGKSNKVFRLVCHFIVQNPEICLENLTGGDHSDINGASAGHDSTDPSIELLSKVTTVFPTISDSWSSFSLFLLFVCVAR